MVEINSFIKITSHFNSLSLLSFESERKRKLCRARASVSVFLWLAG